jgi:uroporphyrinogen-III decarboxylase
VLLKGSPADVERAVLLCIEAAAEGGGYILGTADSTVVGTPFENIHAFVEAGRKYGRY